MHPKTTARQAALRALVASEKAELVAPDFAGVDASVRPFARELYSGVQRERARLDWSLAPLLSKPLERLDASVRAALRLAGYEKWVLKTPPHGFVSAYVDLVKAEKLASASGFVNAVQRRLPDQWRALPDAQPARFAVEWSHPEWLVARYLERFGEAETEALLRFNNTRAPLCLRVNTLRTSREALLQELPQARPGSLSPDAILLENGGDPTRFEAWNRGELFAQDEAAQLVSRFAAPQKDDLVLDLAGAPGGKATHLAQLMGDEGRVLVGDVAPGRLKLVRQNAQRLGLKSVETLVSDARQFGAQWQGPKADLVLLDVPCLGTGTLRRRPDARWRKTPQMLAELVTLGRELLLAARELVAEGGVLVYSTCSLEVEENEEQARWFAHEVGWPIVAPDGAVPASVVTSEGFLQTLPHRHGCDGAFAVRFVNAPHSPSP